MLVALWINANSEGPGRIPVKVVKAFSANQSPEGIVADANGLLFISLRNTGDNGFRSNKVAKVLTDGNLELIAEFGATGPGMSGILGLAMGRDQSIYCTFTSGDERHGVWRITDSGEKEKLPGSGSIQMPNAIAIGGDNSLFVTDSDPLDQGEAGVWRFTKETGAFEPWCDDPLIRSDPSNPNGGFPVPAANGVAYVSPNSLYVANTEKSLIAKISILEDGSAGMVSLVAGGSPLILNPDGLVVDSMDRLYAVLPMATVNLPADMGGPLPPMSPIVQINQNSGQIVPMLDPVAFPDADYFDFPTSLSVVESTSQEIRIFVSSMGSANYNFPPGTGAKLTELNIGKVSESCEE